MPTVPAPVVFLHIPKTAGSSLINELGSLHRPALSIEAVWRAGEQRHDPDNETLLRRHRAEIAANVYPFVHGHFTRRELLSTLGEMPMRLITFVRDPVARLVSEYFYVTSPAHPTAAEVRATYPTLEHFVEECIPIRNSMHSYLRRSDDESAERTAQSLADYAFVGRVEYYADDFKRLTTMLGHPSLASLRENVGVKAPRLTQNLRARIATYNAADALIYDAVANHAQVA